MDQLLEFSQAHEEDIKFRQWENEAELMVISRLETAVGQYRHAETIRFGIFGTTFSTI